MTRASAKANNVYGDGWEWEFNLTVWNLSETSLKMKFDQWTGNGTVNAGSNMQFSVNNKATWTDIVQNNSYGTAANIGGIDLGTEAGRQVKVIVRMKVPIGTKTGAYNSNFGILTE